MPSRKKAKRNITGLRNQQQPDSTPSAVAGDSEDTNDDGFMPGIYFDSMRVDWENDDESDIESELDQDDFEDEDFSISLLEIAEKEDAKDLDWLPPRLPDMRDRKKKEHPQHYNTTADGMNKSQSTAYRLASEFKHQKLLDTFGFSSSHPVTSTLPVTSKKPPAAWKEAILQQDGPQGRALANTDSRDSSDDDIQILSGPPSRTSSPIADKSPGSPRVPAVRCASQSPEASDQDLPPISEPVSAAVSDDEDIVQMSEPVFSAAASEIGDDMTNEQMTTQDELEEQQGEAWEDELEENIASTVKGPPRPWDEIRKEVKAELKKNSKIMPLSRVNQLMIVSNFATLRLKGSGTMEREKGTGLHAESGHWHGIISSLETSHARFMGELVLHSLGFMMSRLNCGHHNICAAYQQAK
ncbi:hypothetical protein B0H13DRAFT_1890044 [Mycena leptocephala]|nr:hypothetical protein B0H13DRAFT_1890044 [Mycena leptocephala]